MAINSMRLRAYAAQELDLRAEKIVDLASQLGTEAFECTVAFEPLGDFLEHVLEEGGKHPSVEALAADVRTNCKGWDGEDEDIDEEAAGSSLASYGYYGFAVQFATPVRYFRSPTVWQSGWGHYYTKWIYAESFDEAWELGKAWAQECSENDLAEFKAKQEGGAV